MTLSELSALLNAYIDGNPHAARMPVLFREVGYDAVQEPVGDNPFMETEDGTTYLVITTREP